MKIGYARGSTQDQNLALQLDALKSSGCEKIFQEKASGAKTDRPELTKLLEHVREGDTVVIWKLDRLGRSLTQLIDVVTQLESKGAGLVSLNDPVDATTAQGRLVFRIFARLAEFERELIRDALLPAKLPPADVASIWASARGYQSRPRINHGSWRVSTKRKSYRLTRLLYRRISPSPHCISIYGIVELK